MPSLDTDSDGTAIEGATGMSYVVMPTDDGGSYIRVVVSFMDSKGNPESLTSASVIVNTAATGEISITGVPVVGQELDVDVSEVRDANSDVADDPINNPSYQWYGGDTPDFTPTSGNAISSATEEATYTPVADDGGSYIRVVVSFTDDLGFSESIASSSVLVSHTDLCNRTQAVRDAIVMAVDGVDSCALVTPSHLAAIIGELDLSGQSLAPLVASDYVGLTGLTSLNLSDNGLTLLNSADFASFTNLTTLNLSGNGLSTIPIDVLPSSLTSLDLSGNNLEEFPREAIDQLAALSTLRLENNPSSAPVAFDIPYKLVRRDDGTGTPATVAVRLPAYVPDGLRVLLASVSASSGTITDGSGTSLSSVAVDTDFTVTQTERVAVILTATPPSSQPDSQTESNGMQLSASPELTVIGANSEATGTPAISGVRVVGQSLMATLPTAGPGAVADEDGLPDPLTLLYQWHKSTTDGFVPDGTTAIAGAEQDTYDVMAEDMGVYILVAVSFEDGRGFTETLRSSQVRINTMAMGLPVITGIE